MYVEDDLSGLFEIPLVLVVEKRRSKLKNVTKPPVTTTFKLFSSASKQILSVHQSQADDDTTGSFGCTTQIKQAQACCVVNTALFIH
jgi:hypothetical protein